MDMAKNRMDSLRTKLRNAKMTGRNRELAKAGASAGVGAVVGGTTVAVTGMTAVGAVGAGAGIGAAAGPVGVAAGAVIGLAAYGIYKAFKK